jgi:hypothetical protein
MGRAGASEDGCTKAQTGLPATTGTPRPRTLLKCRGRSPGSRVTALVRPSRDLAISVTQFGQSLAAYSCGGSSGIARYGLTGFPLSSERNTLREPRHLYLVGDSSWRRNGSSKMWLICTWHVQQMHNTTASPCAVRRARSPSRHLVGWVEALIDRAPVRPAFLYRSCYRVGGSHLPPNRLF